MSSLWEDLQATYPDPSYHYAIECSNDTELTHHPISIPMTLEEVTYLLQVGMTGCPAGGWSRGTRVELETT